MSGRLCPRCRPEAGWPRGHAHRLAPCTDRDPLDVALEADGVEILRAEDVQVGRRGPTRTS
ncbi:hypothetical protein [Streptomyces sp. NPDC005407]|uniref:hypothetical protein n=1 Tax=Streptomyces sp. NPDC005407 TaxID=3155340 RepID=UPI0033BC509E